jgi:hypothetical protein
MRIDGIDKETLAKSRIRKITLDAEKIQYQLASFPSQEARD